MEAISETPFDLLVEGTGLAQSLLALSLSRSSKKVLHVDRNAYYGGAEAALSLQDAEEWVGAVNKGAPLAFSDAHIERTESSSSEEAAKGSPKLGFSRAYSLALAPQIVYSKSVLLPTLVSSKIYRQLDFLAVGTWWIYKPANEGDGASLRKIPGSREDVFADKSIDLKGKRSLMKFLKFITDPEAFEQAMQEHGDLMLEEFLLEQYSITVDLQPTLQALTLSSLPASQTRVSFALPRILRHLSSIGMFGPGFGAVVPKWGGLAEICQVGCRASAVGGSIYMLGQGIQETSETTSDGFKQLRLDNGEQVRARWHARQKGNFPPSQKGKEECGILTRSVSIINSDLPSLFPPIADGAPPSACTVIVFPPGSMGLAGLTLPAPIYFIVHSSETGECPAGQSVIYGSIRSAADEGKGWLKMATDALLRATVVGQQIPDTLWSLSYSQEASSAESSISQDNVGPVIENQTVSFSNSSTDLAFDDGVLREVRKAWQQISGNEEGFMDFEDREVGEYDDEAQ